MIFRYKLIIEYNGINYVGWQRQKKSFPSVQESLHKAFKIFSRHNVLIYASGRTDAGVHALGQVAHVDLEKKWPVSTIYSAINFYLETQSIVIISVEQVSIRFHARFSAIKRHYMYRLINRNSCLSINASVVCLINYPLNVDNMNKSAKLFLGSHDFKSFRSKSCQSISSIKTLDLLEFYQEGSEIKVFISARSFLHNQVRNIIGILILIGSGKILPYHISDILYFNNKNYVRFTAPACGLYLNKVDYNIISY